MLCPPAQVEADLLELDSEGAIDRMSAIASDVDHHLSSSVLKDAGDGSGEPGLLRPTKWPRVAGHAARSVVSEVESTVLDAVLSQFSALTKKPGAKSAP